MPEYISIKSGYHSLCVCWFFFICSETQYVHTQNMGFVLFAVLNATSIMCLRMRNIVLSHLSSALCVCVCALKFHSNSSHTKL